MDVMTSVSTINYQRCLNVVVIVALFESVLARHQLQFVNVNKLELCSARRVLEPTRIERLSLGHGDKRHHNGLSASQHHSELRRNCNRNKRSPTVGIERWFWLGLQTNTAALSSFAPHLDHEWARLFDEPRILRYAVVRVIPSFLQNNVTPPAIFVNMLLGNEIHGVATKGFPKVVLALALVLLLVNALLLCQDQVSHVSLVQTTVTRSRWPRREVGGDLGV
jgi:hypothetical protein